MGNKATVDVKDMAWIEIYVLDQASRNDKRHIFATNMMKCVYGLCMGHRGVIDYSEYEHRLSKGNMFMLKMVHKVGRCIPYKWITALYQKLAMYAAKEDCDDYFISDLPIVYIQRRHKKSFFRDGIPKPFRDFEVMVPSDYDGLLKDMGYGNYMQFPRLSVRKPSHYFNTDIQLW